MSEIIFLHIISHNDSRAFILGLASPAILVIKLVVSLSKIVMPDLPCATAAPNRHRGVNIEQASRGA